jgi:NRPS condensation-like uncharacterized protein
MPFHAEAGPVMRVSSLEHGVLSRLIVSVPHMASDGGGLKALANILGARLYGVPPGRPVSNRRGLLQIAGGIRLLQLPTLAAEALREIFRPLGILRVQPLAKGFAPRGGDAQPIWRTVSLTGEPARHFAAFCRKNGSTINDGLVAMLAMLAAGRSERGPVAVGYTIDLRRYLPSPVSVVTNLHATTLAVVERSLLDAPSSAVRAISRRTAVEKRRMFGMAYALLPVIQVGWLPRGWLRWIAWMLVSRLFSYVRRALVFTNIGALDEALAPFGGDAVSASVIGPFVNESPVPVVTVTGFRGDLTMQVCQAGNLALEAVDEYSAELLAALKRLDG